MLKSGLITGVAAFVLAIAGSFVTALVCVPCWSLLTGLVAGYLSGRLDRPLTTNASAKSGAGAGAIAGVGGLAGQVVGSLLNAAVVGPEFAARLARQLGLPASNNPAGFYVGTFGLGCCLGVFALVLMAGLGAVGGLLWYQLSGKKAAAAS